MKRNFHLKTVIYLSNAAVFIIPMAVFAFIVIAVLTAHLSEEIQKRNLIVSRHIDGTINGFLDKPARLLNEMRTMLKEGGPSTDRRMKGSIIDYIRKNHSYFESIRVLDSNLTITYLSPYDETHIGFSMKYTPFISKNGNENRSETLPYWSDVFISLKAAQPVTTISLPLNNGYIVAYLNLSDLWRRMKEMYLENDMELSVLDTTGTYIFDSNETNILQRNIFPRFHTLPKDPPKAEALQITRNGRVKLLYFNKISNTRWYCAIMIDKETVERPVTMLRNAFLAGIFLFLVIIMIVSFLSGRSIVLPIRNLVEKTRQVAEGDYTTPIAYDGYHEFTILASHFNAMIRNINTRETQLHEQRRSLETLVRECKKTESLLAAEKERLSITLRSIGDGVITTDSTGRIVLMNDVAESLTGWGLHEAQGKMLEDVFTIVHETTKIPCDTPFKEVQSSGEVTRFAHQTLLISRDGTERFIASSGAPIKDTNGTTGGIVLVFHDETEKHTMQTALERTARLNSLGILAGGIAHDFNNLLSGIFGYIDLAHKSTMDATPATYLERALNTMERARGLTQQLLTFAKGGEPNRTVDHLFPLVQQVAQFALSGSTVSCQYDVPRNLWCCDYDKNQVSQVFNNIIINAKQSMPDGGTIHVRGTNVTFKDKEHPPLRPGDYVAISIQDNGCGIAQEILPHIFDPFFTTKAHGYGLGLTTSYSIITRHNGCIDAESGYGKGSTFHIYLPAKKQPEQPSGQPSAAPAASRIPEPHRGRGTILVMDDEEIIRTMLGALLKSLGYSVVEKADGGEAVDYFTAHINTGLKPVAVILDLTVPGGVGGKEAVVRIRDLDKQIPVFVASGYSQDAVVANPNEYGFTGSILKPFRLSELVRLLEDHLET